MIKLGSKVRDKITGLEGIAVSRIEFLNGCIQYELMPKCKNKNEPVKEGVFLDEAILEIIPVKRKVIKKQDTGGGFRNYPK